MPKSSAYPSLDGLFDLACRDGVDIRPTLLRVLTDLYVQKPVHTADEEAQYVELARAPDRSGRCRHARDGGRAAGRLCGGAGGDPAQPRRGRRAGTGRKRHPQPPPSRAQPDLAELFFAANADERRLILINLDLAAESLRRRPAPVAADADAAGWRTPRCNATRANSPARSNARSASRTALAERIARDHSGEPIVVAAKALGMQAAVLQRILLFLNPAVGQSVERVYDLARLYDEITPAARRAHAGDLAAGGQPRAKPAHAPVHYDDERRSARAAATPRRASRRARARAATPPRTRSDGR